MEGSVVGAGFYKFWNLRSTTDGRTNCEVKSTAKSTGAGTGRRQMRALWLLLGRSDIVGAALVHPKQRPHAQTLMEVAVLTLLADHASALAWDRKYQSVGLPIHGQVARACDALGHQRTRLQFSSMLSEL